MKNYYKILGVNKHSTNNDIKSSYRNLAKKYHPDVNKEQDAKKKFQSIAEAYEILSDKNKKDTYDRILEDIIHKKYSEEKEKSDDYKKYRSWENSAKEKAKQYSEMPLDDILKQLKIVAENVFTHYVILGMFGVAPLLFGGPFGLIIGGVVFYLYYDEYKNSGKDLLSFIIDGIFKKK